MLEGVFDKALIPTYYTSFVFIIKRRETRIRWKKVSGVSGADTVSHGHQVSLHCHIESAAPSSTRGLANMACSLPSSQNT